MTEQAIAILRDFILARSPVSDEQARLLRALEELEREVTSLKIDNSLLNHALDKVKVRLGATRERLASR